jgi:hypothetical protein
MKKIVAISLAVVLVAGLVGAGVAYAEGNGLKASKATAKVAEFTLIDWQNPGVVDADYDPDYDLNIPDDSYDSGWTPILSQNIKTPNQMDLFVDVSLETGLWTRTKVKSKVTEDYPWGEWDTSKAQAQVLVRVGVDGEYATAAVGEQEAGVAFPREVTFNEREQVLSAKFMGIFTGDCLNVVLADPQIDNDEDGYINEDPADFDEAGNPIDNDGDGLYNEDPVDYIITIDYDCLQPEELDLLLRTMSANAFNFIVADLEPGEHTITVEAKIITNGEADQGNYQAMALVGQGSVVIEGVRMMKGEDYLDMPPD